MKRLTTMVVLVAALTLLAAAGGSARSTAPAETSAARATSLTVWVGWSARELSEFKKVVAEYDAKNPDVTVKVVGGINDDKITAALRSGNGPDVVSSFTSSNVGLYCSSGGWIDLAPYISKSKIDIEPVPGVDALLHAVRGQALRPAAARRRLRLLLQQGALQEGRPDRPAEDDGRAHRLRQEADGEERRRLAQGRRLRPGVRLLPEHSGAYQTLFGAKWFDSQGKSSLSTDPAWSRLLKWQKNLVDFYGHDKLVKWQAGAGDEFSASHAFETGKLAMMMDGEWRVSFIASEHPDLAYATAPMPVDGAKANLYGGGYINGTIIGIPKNGKNKDAAWDLVKYLTTNDHALAKFSNGIRNVPSTRSSSKSKELKPDKNFAIFSKIFVNPHSTTTPITSAGAEYLESFQSYLAKWQSGKAKDLQKDLAELDKQIDAKLKQTGGGVP